MDGEDFSFDTPITDHTVLTARWAATAYAITYLHMDGVSHSNPASYTIESDAIALNAVNREGYDFGGWYTREDFTETSRVAGIAIAHGSTGAKIFYAKWTAITFGVNFNDNTQSNKTASQSFTYLPIRAIPLRGGTPRQMAPAQAIPTAKRSGI